jgi:sortase A
LSTDVTDYIPHTRQSTAAAGVRTLGRVQARTLVRWLGGALFALGVLLLVWGFVVWRWGDPVTAVYTEWQQRRLSDAYERVAERYAVKHVVRTVSPAREARELRRAAKGFRLASEEGDPIGRIRVARLGLNMILVNGTHTDSLRRGPGRDRRTFMPGEGELVYIAGHRTTYAAPFAHIDRLKPGDRVVLEMPYGRFVYAVTGSVIVPADDLSRLRSHHREVVALQACHPRFSARERYIVYARPLPGAKGVTA